MEDYLTWKDVKRFIHGSFKHNLFLEFYLDSLFKSKYMKKTYLQGVQELQQKALEPFADIPDALKKCKGVVSLFKKEDEVQFRLDVNLFIQGIMCFYARKPVINEEYNALATLYYEGKVEEYIAQTKEVLKKIKRDYNDELNRQTSIFKNKDELLEGRHVITWMIRNIEKVVSQYGIEVPETMLSCFDQDRFLLFIVQCATNSVVLAMEDDKQTVPSNFSFINNYFRYIHYRRKEQKDFNPKYVVKRRNIVQKEGIVHALSILEYIEQFCLDKPTIDFTLFGFQSDEEMLQTCLTDLNEKIENKRQEEIRKQKIEEFRKGIELNWEFFPNGEKSYKTKKGIGRNKKTDKEKYELQERKEILLERKLDLFKDLPYIAVLRGTNHFEGYMAYVFANGKVIFEKFYKKTKNGLVPTINEAIYIINIAYFSELSKGTKPDIHAFINKEIDPDAKVIYHTSFFEKRVQREVENIEYNDAILTYVESLVSSLKKEKEIVKK